MEIGKSLAYALVGSLNHIRTAHIEGGELSGNIDAIRHAVTKLCHFTLLETRPLSLGN